MIPQMRFLQRGTCPCHTSWITTGKVLEKSWRMTVRKEQEPESTAQDVSFLHFLLPFSCWSVTFAARSLIHYLVILPIISHSPGLPLSASSLSKHTR